MNNIIELPVEHLSYSALKTLCSNPHAFKKQYILNLWDFKDSPAAVAGKAGHKVLEMYYAGMKLDAAMREGVKLIDGIPDNQIKWGKTGSREDILKFVNQGIKFFFNEEPTLGKVLDTEKSMIVPCRFEIGEGPLPLKGKTDLVSEMEDGVHIWDWKFVKSHSDPDEEQSAHIMQSMFNYHMVRETYHKDPIAMHFIEIKLSKNKDGRPQVADYLIDFRKHNEYFLYFQAIYSGAIQLLANPDYLFLPNFGDVFTGKEAWADFTREIYEENQFGVPKNVRHRSTLERKIVDNKFIESESSAVTADTLEPEEKIASKLLEFGYPMTFVEKHEGANVTLYMYRPSRGVKMADVKRHAADLALALGKASVRIQAPVLGTKYVGIEVANEKQRVINFTPNLVHEETLDIPLGQDVMNETHYLDLARAPHLLVAGTTGSGKSIFLNTLINTLTKANTPDQLGIVLIDPKMTEFADFAGLEHNLTKSVLTEPDAIADCLEWAITEMNNRYSLLQGRQVRNIDEYNEMSTSPLKKIVIVIDEFADLMLTDDKRTIVLQEGVDEFEAEELRGRRRDRKLPAGVKVRVTKDVSINKIIENSVIRLAQKARAAGIHLVVATQRPSVNVITGIIKANFPTRISFMVASQVDSKVILDAPGAEDLMGNGDCLVMDPKVKGLTRLQAFYLPQ